MKEQEILNEFIDSGSILKGHFKLSSGLHSDTYLQCAKVLMNTKRAEKLCKELVARINAKFGENYFDLVISPAMGGVVVGYEVARQLGVDSIFCERVDGKFEFRRGFEVPSNAKILVVEDVLTTGKSSLETFDVIKAHGGIVLAEACLIDRSGGKATLGVPLISLLQLNIEAYEENALPDALKDIEITKPGSRYLNQKAAG